MLNSATTTRRAKRVRGVVKTEAKQPVNQKGKECKSNTAYSTTRILALIAIGMLIIFVSSTVFGNSESPETVIEYQAAEPPSLVVVGSINGGTSALNAIILWHFKTFYHGMNGLVDGRYWLHCMPLDYTQFGIKQTANEQVETASFKSTNWKDWSYAFADLRGLGPEGNQHQCTHHEYMQWIGVDRTDNAFGHILVDEEQYQQHRKTDERWPDEALADTRYFWERCSGYNGQPHVAMILAANFGRTKLLYMMRDPLIQHYSRIRHFDEHAFQQKQNKNNMSAVEANRRFGKISQMLHGDDFSVLLNLLRSDTDDDDESSTNEDEIVAWYFTLWARLGIRWRDHRLFDICPVVNLLTFIKGQQHFQQHTHNIKVAQFEVFSSGSDGVIQTSIRMWCFATGHDLDECYSKYSSNQYAALDEIMWNWKDFVNNPHYGKLQSYDIRLSDLAILDSILDVMTVCDQRLLRVLHKYEVVLGEFDMNLWSEQRQDFRQQVLARSKQ